MLTYFSDGVMITPMGWIDGGWAGPAGMPGPEAAADATSMDVFKMGCITTPPLSLELNSFTNFPTVG
jgi:hypothetical protein